MKCPLLQRYLIEGENEALEVFDDCLRAKCDWFDENVDRCAVLGLSRQLNAIGNTLGRISLDYNLARYTFRCHYCGLTITTGPGDPGDQPAGWTYNEQVDGRFCRLCDRCSAVRSF